MKTRDQIVARLEHLQALARESRERLRDVKDWQEAHRLLQQANNWEAGFDWLSWAISGDQQ